LFFNRQISALAPGALYLDRGSADGPDDTGEAFSPPPDVRRPDPSGADQIDVEQEATDLAVVDSVGMGCYQRQPI